MRKCKSLLIASLLLLFTACGSKNKSNEEETTTLTPETTEVSGDMEGCFKVVEREYTPTGGYSKLLTVDIERTDEPLPFVENGMILSFSQRTSAANTQVGFGIEFLDEKGNVLDKVSANGSGFSGSYDSDEAIEIVKLKPGKKGTIRFSVDSDAEKATKFRISSAYQVNEGRECDVDYSSNSSSGYSSETEDDERASDDYSNSGSSSSSSVDVDAWLDKYEQLVNRSISIAKKVQNGDMSAMSDYATLTSQIQDLYNDIESVSEKMIPAQTARLSKILAKAAEVK